MFFINPFIYAGGGDFESIATVTVGSGGAANIEFTNIGTDWQHLHVRVLGRSTRSNTQDYYKLQMNADTGSNYSRHQLDGDGSSATAAGAASSAFIAVATMTAANASASIFGASFFDILDYASTSKNKTVRALYGEDRNGAGIVGLTSGAWLSTNAITSIKIFPNGGDWAQHSTAALYGLKAPA